MDTPSSSWSSGERGPDAAKPAAGSVGLRAVSEAMVDGDDSVEKGLLSTSLLLSRSVEQQAVPDLFTMTIDQRQE